MQFSEQQQKAQEFEYKINTKCWEDESFKNDFIANPAATLELFTGSPISLPEGKKLKVLDQTDSENKIYINIYPEPNLDEMQLSDEQLELVAGGSSPFCIWGGLFCLGIVVGMNQQ